MSDQIFASVSDFLSPLNKLGLQNKSGVQTPPSPMPQEPAQPSALQKFLSNPMMLNILAQQGYSTTPGPGPLGVIGRAGLATQQQKQIGEQLNLQNELLRARIGLADRKASEGATESPFSKINLSDFTIESSQKYQQSGNVGDLVFRDQPATDPAAVKEFEYFKQLSPEQQKQYLNVRRRPGFENIAGHGAGPIDPLSGQVEVSVSESTIQDGLRDRASAQNEGTNARTDRRALPANIAKYDQQIERAKGFIKAFENGMLDSGPIIDGKIAAFTPVGQDFAAFAGENVLNLISSATFGQLSEGEREFLRRISFSLEKDEDINVQDLERFIEVLEKSRDIETAELNRMQQTEGVDEFAGFSIKRD